MNDGTKLFQDLVNEYAGSIGLSSLSLDDAGRCSLQFDDKLSVTMQCHEETGALVIFSEIGSVPSEREQDFCRRMLEGNYFWQHTGGLGTLALAPNEDSNAPRMAVLFYQTPLQSLDYGTFQNRLTDFVDTAEAWSDYLQNFEQPAESGGDSQMDTFMAGSMFRV